jgi:hypothetical protein
MTRMFCLQLSPLSKEAIHNIRLQRIGRYVTSLDTEGRILIMRFPDGILRATINLTSKGNQARFIKLVEQSLNRGRKDLRSFGSVNSLFSLGMILALVARETSLERKFHLPIRVIRGYTTDNLGGLLLASLNQTLMLQH